MHVVSSVCPHQGASLVQGSIRDWYDITDSTATSKKMCIVCPYHGFYFHLLDGKYIDTTTTTLRPNKRQHNIFIRTLNVTHDNDFIYATTADDELPIFHPYEENDSSFVSISGEMDIKQNQDIVTENILDMLHISHVHFFGNRDKPLPFDMKFEKLSNYSGRSTFYYHSGLMSMSRQLAKADCVIVENEYHLPSTTITRVKANGMIKTVLTRALRVNEKETKLFYKLYRNFWTNTPILRWLGDLVLHVMMRWTLKEDQDILYTIENDQYGKGFSTVYDRTILSYRQSKKRYNKK